MAEKTAIVTVGYNTFSSDNDCSGVLFEVPNTQVVGGDNVEIRLWAGDFETLSPFYLMQGTSSMGPGQQVLLPSGNFTEDISFSNTPTARTTWSMSSLVSVIALAYVEGVAEVNQDITSLFMGSSDLLTTIDNLLLTTTVRVTYVVSQAVNVNIDFAQTYNYQAEWPIANVISVVALNEICALDPQTGEVFTWAVRGEDVTARFIKFGGSCVRQVDDIELFGSVQLQYNRVAYYKKWYWPVPTGSEGLYWFFIYQGFTIKNKFSISLPDLTEGLPEPRNIAMTVLARGTDVLLVGAYVYIDDLYVGLTDDSGTIYVNGIMQGPHTLRVTKIGYIDTDKDALYNDEFTVY